MQDTINLKTNGTNGDFCIRCHTPIGMDLGRAVSTSRNMDRAPVVARGHHLRRLPPRAQGLRQDQRPPGAGRGQPVRAGLRPDRGRRAEARAPSARGVPGGDLATTSRGARSTPRSIKFFQLTEPGFCGTCHDVTLLNGFRLEEAFSEFKSSPAAKRGVTCQDCHMGKEPGEASGYGEGPAAIVGRRTDPAGSSPTTTSPGPTTPIIHPGLFPHNVRRARSSRRCGNGCSSTGRRAGAPTRSRTPSRRTTSSPRPGSPSTTATTPARSSKTSSSARPGAGSAAQGAAQRLSAGRHRGRDRPTRAASGSGRGRERHRRPQRSRPASTPSAWSSSRSRVTDATGKVVYASGDLDPNGDVRDPHSLYVHDGELPLD